MNNLDTPRESVLRTFRREPVSKIVWQPRIYSWYYANRLPNRVPEGYQGRSALNYYYRTLQPYEGPVPHKYRRMSMIEVYDDLHSSPRYSPEVLGIPVLTQPIDRTKVGVSVRFDGPDVIIRYDTPRGTLREVFRYGRHIEHPIKGPTT